MKYLLGNKCPPHSFTFFGAIGMGRVLEFRHDSDKFNGNDEEQGGAVTITVANAMSTLPVLL